jgi:hypothetical protein
VSFTFSHQCCVTWIEIQVTVKSCSPLKEGGAVAVGACSPELLYSSPQRNDQHDIDNFEACRVNLKKSFEKNGKSAGGGDTGD